MLQLIAFKFTGKISSSIEFIHGYLQRYVAFYIHATAANNPRTKDEIVIATFEPDEETTDAFGREAVVVVARYE